MLGNLSLAYLYVRVAQNFRRSTSISHKLRGGCQMFVIASESEAIQSNNIAI